MYHDTGIFTIVDSEGEGKITNERECNTIVLNGGKIVFAEGSVENTITSGKTINVTYSGAVTVTGGAIKSTGAVNVSGATVSANTGIAIFQENKGKITIGGTALVTSAKEFVTAGYIEPSRA